MRKELDEQLCKNFPRVFRNRYGDMSETCMCWGFDCGDGWYDIISDAATKIEAEIDKMTAEEWAECVEYGSCAASQIKEKYGTLRFYLSGGTEAMWAAVSEAENKSAKICEQCGEPGRIRGHSWYYTACDAHTRPEDTVENE